MTPPRSTARGKAGLTLVEILISMMLLGLVVSTSGWVMSQAVTAKAQLLDEPLTGALLAGEIHELALGLPTSPSGLSTATLGYEVTALDRLDGAAFSPPIDSNGFNITTHADWKQAVTLKLHDLGEQLDSGYAPTDPYGSRVVKLEVVISHRGQLQGTYTWWLNP